MSQITLRQIPVSLEKQIRDEAKQKNESLSQVVINMLKKYFGHTGEVSKKRDLSNFVGTWKNSEVKNFNKTNSIFSKIDKKLWEK